MSLQKDMITIGADIGGSHITACVINSMDFSVRENSRIRKRLDTHGNKEDILSVWIDAILAVMEHYPGRDFRLGIAMPGPFDYQNGISKITGMNKYEALFGTDVRSYLSERLGIDPDHIRFRNDAEAFLHGEVVSGAAMGYEKSMGITLGTGLGSARSVRGLTEDANLGVSLFKDGIAEDYLSTRWFVERYFELSGKRLPDTKAIVEQYGHDPVIKVLFGDFSRNLSDFITSCIFEMETDIVVIGGNISKAEHLFLENVRSSLKTRGIITRLAISELGEDAAMVGAAFLWNQSKAIKLV